MALYLVPLVSFWSLGLAVQERTQVFCSSSSSSSPFKVLCSIDKPCNDVDIYCSGDTSTQELWVDCNGAHSCVGLNIYSSKDTLIRCRGRTGSCQNMNIYCGEVASMVESLDNGVSFSDNSNAVSCQFRHMDSRVTLTTSFGCYGNVAQCTSSANGYLSLTDSSMICDTTNGTPCVMQCSTDNSCMDNSIDCETSDSSLCQCQPAVNCQNVLITSPTMSTTSITGVSATTTTASSNTGTPQTTQGSSNTEGPATTQGTGIPATTEGSSNTGGPATTQGTGIPATTGGSSNTGGPATTQGTGIPATTGGSSNTGGPATTGGSSNTGEPATTLSQVAQSTNPVTSRIAAAETNETVKSTNDSLKLWQLVLIIVLLLVAVIACFAGGYILKRWKASGDSKEVKEGDDPKWGIYPPPTIIPIPTKTETGGESPNVTITLQTTPSLHEPETQPVTDLKTETIADGEPQQTPVHLEKAIV